MLVDRYYTTTIHQQANIVTEACRQDQKFIIVASHASQSPRARRDDACTPCHFIHCELDENTSCRYRCAIESTWHARAGWHDPARTAQPQPPHQHVHTVMWSWLAHSELHVSLGRRAAGSGRGPNCPGKLLLYSSQYYVIRNQTVVHNQNVRLYNLPIIQALIGELGLGVETTHRTSGVGLLSPNNNNYLIKIFLFCISCLILLILLQSYRRAVII